MACLTMTESEFESAMNHWTRWCRNDGLSKDHCRSLEHLWKSPQIWHQEVLQVQIDIPLAQKVEKAVIGLKEASRIIIVYNYITPTANFFKVCRLAGTKPHLFDECLTEAKKNIQNTLLTY